MFNEAISGLVRFTSPTGKQMVEHFRDKTLPEALSSTGLLATGMIIDMTVNLALLDSAYNLKLFPNNPLTMLIRNPQEAIIYKLAYNMGIEMVTNYLSPQQLGEPKDYSGISDHLLIPS